MRLYDIIRNNIFYLNSKSPRRKWLLSYLPMEFHVLDMNNDFIELDIKYTSDPHRIARLNSKNKALNIPCDKKGIIIGCDTVVYAEGRIFGKPDSREDAYKTLTFLSDRTHSVISGITLHNTSNNTIIVDSEETLIRFRKIKEEEIIDYIGSGEPFDKAGSYALQDNAGRFLLDIKGTKSNVYGLPLKTLVNMILRMKYIL